MELTFGLLFCLLSIGHLHGAAIDNVEVDGYVYEKPSISFPENNIQEQSEPQIPNEKYEPQIPNEQYEPQIPNEQYEPQTPHVQDVPQTPFIDDVKESVDATPDYPDIDLRGNLVEFQFPSPYFNATEEESHFEHQELASKTEARRRGPVKRIKFKGVLDNFNYTSYAASVALCGSEADLPKVTPTFAYAFKDEKRPPNRRLAPYTEVEVDEAYFQQ